MNKLYKEKATLSSFTSLSNNDLINITGGSTERGPGEAEEGPIIIPPFCDRSNDNDGVFQSVQTPTEGV